MVQELLHCLFSHELGSKLCPQPLLLNAQFVVLPFSLKTHLIIELAQQPFFLYPQCVGQTLLLSIKFFLEPSLLDYKTSQERDKGNHDGNDGCQVTHRCPFLHLQVL